jgi:hypothetical protein
MEASSGDQSSVQRFCGAASATEDLSYLEDLQKLEVRRQFLQRSIVRAEEACRWLQQRLQSDQADAETEQMLQQAQRTLDLYHALFSQSCAQSAAILNALSAAQLEEGGGAAAAHSCM